MSNWVQKDTFLGEADLSIVDAVGPGPVNLVAGTGSGRAAFPGAIVRGYHPDFGEAEFIFLKGVASLAVGDVVSYNALTGATTRWAGTANSGAPLAVAISTPSSSQWGWFAVGGNVPANVSGTVAAGDIVNFASTATLKSAAAAGKQVLNAVAASANGATVGGTVLVSTQAVYSVMRPFCQGAIT
jgi:hypothetical protein